MMNNAEFANEVMKVLMVRSSCRSFTEEKIPDKILNQILKAGVQAPSGGNLQPYSIIKVKKQETKDKLSKLCTNQKFISKAPVDLIFCIDWRRIQRWADLEKAPFTATSSFRHFWISFLDTAICAQNVCTAADSLGLGSVYVGSVLECFMELKELLRLPNGVLPVVLLSLGYPKYKPIVKKKLDIDTIIHDEEYHEIEDDKLLEAFNNKYEGWKLDIKDKKIGNIYENYHEVEEQQLLDKQNKKQSEWKMEITDKRLREIYEVCFDIQGEEFAKECIENIKKQGYINHVQYRFGMHYKANLMPTNNEKFIEIMKKCGFHWLEKFRCYEK